MTYNSTSKDSCSSIPIGTHTKNYCDAKLILFKFGFGSAITKINFE